MKDFLNVIFFVIGISHGFSQEVQDFSLVNIADGKNVSLSGFTKYKAIAIVFTSNVCPYDNHYRERIKQLSDSYKGTIQFLLINSYLEPREDAKSMEKNYASWRLDIPYLVDKEQIAMNSLGATKSPEVFLLKKVGNVNTIVYKGAIDDNPLVTTDVNNAYLKIAIDQFLAGKRINSPDNRAAGCTIRKK